MKNKFNYLLKTVFLSFVILFISCETQEEVVSNSKRDIKKTHITLKELSSKPNAVSKIQEFKTKKSNMDSGKLVYNEEYDFFIDDQNMLLIEEGSKHWITIPIYRKKPNANLENLILKPDENGLYKSFLASYQLTDQDRINIKNGIPVLDLDVKTDLYALDGKYVGQLYDLGNGDCGYVNHINQITSSTIEVTFVLAPCNGTQIQYGYTENVPSNTTGGASGYVPSGYTPNFNGGNGGVGSFPTGNGSNGTQQTSGSSSSNNNILTEPTISFEEAALTSFVKNLSVEQREFLFPTVSIDSLQQNTENETWTSIVNYFGENGQTAENEESIKDMIDFCNENDATFVLTDIDESNSINISNITELQSLINTECTESDEESNTEIIGDEIITSKSINASPLYDLNVFVKQKLSPYSVLNVTSSISGITLGINWAQTEYSVSGTSTSSYYVEVSVFGTISYSLFYEGIGTYFTKNKKYIVLVNKADGDIFASYCD